MKRISLLSLVIVLGGCSTHAVKCHGSLRPINGPTANAMQPTAEPARSPDREN